MEDPHSFDTLRLLEPIGDVPPAEDEARYYKQAAVPEPPNSLSEIPLRFRPRCGRHHVRHTVFCVSG